MAVATQTMTVPTYPSPSNSPSLSVGRSFCISTPQRPLKRTRSSSDSSHDTDHDYSSPVTKAPRLSTQHVPPSIPTTTDDSINMQRQRTMKTIPLRRQASSTDLRSNATQRRQHAPPSSHSTPCTPLQLPSPRRCPAPAPPTSPSPSVDSQICVSPAARTSSPLAPSRSYLPARPIFPRGKGKHGGSLYRKALTSCLAATSTGQRILNLGAHAAVAMESQDVEMDGTSAQPVSDRDRWILIPETEDWDMDF